MLGKTFFFLLFPLRFFTLSEGCKYFWQSEVTGSIQNYIDTPELMFVHLYYKCGFCLGLGFVHLLHFFAIFSTGLVLIITE